MDNKKIDKIKSALRSITLKNQNINLLDSKLINELRFEKNIIYFTLELLPEQLKDSQEIKKTIDKKLLCIEGVKKTEIILNNGSIILMKGEIQSNWLHQLPKMLKIKHPRINLTFRAFKEIKNEY